MKPNLNQAQLYDKASAYCARAEHCASEIKEKLYQWGCREGADPIIDRLIDEGFISHARYATAFANDKFRFQQWGKQKIEAMLRSKHIESEFVESAVEQIDEEEYMAMLRKVGERKKQEVKGKEHAHERYLRSMCARGFSYEEAEVAWES